MPKIIRMSPDYSCELLWDEETADYLELTSLPISPQLIQRMNLWQQAFENILDLDDPANSAFSSEQEEEDFESEGLAIAQQLQAELGFDYEIYYNNQSVLGSNINHRIKVKKEVKG